METATLTIQILTLFVIAVGAIVGIVQLHLLRKQIRADHDWNRRVTSLRFSFSDDPGIAEIRSRLDEHLKVGTRRPGEISLEEIQKLSNTEYPNIRTDLQCVLGRLESMCIAIKNSIVDEQVCEDMLRGVVILYYRFFSQYIEDVRTLRNNPKIYAYLEAHARKWDERNKDIEVRHLTG